MLNFLNANPPMQPPSRGPALNLPPFQWLPAGVSFFRRQMWPIVGCGVLGLAVGVTYLTIATPQYTAVATLVIDTRNAHPVGGQQAAPDWQSESAYVESQLELIRSPATLTGVVDKLHLDQNPAFVSKTPGLIGQAIADVKAWMPWAPTAGTGLDTADRDRAVAETALSRMLHVWRIGTTSVVEVRMQTPNRALSAKLANAVTEAYMAQQLVAISDTTHRAGTWLQSRIGELRGQAVAADRAVQEYKAQHGIVDVATGNGTELMNEQQLGQLNIQVASARARVAETQARYQRAVASTVNGVTAGGVVSDGPQNTVMARLQQQYFDAARREADLKARMGPTHASVILQHNVVMEIRQSIQEELARLVQTYHGDYQVAQANLTAIQARLDQQVKEAAQTNIERSELRSLQSSADAYRQIYGNFLERFTQAMQDQSYPITDARVAAPAIPPMDRSSPRTLIALAITLTLGLALGALIAVSREALDLSIRTKAQLRDVTGLECLGAVSKMKALICRHDARWRQAARNRATQGGMVVPSAFRQAAINADSSIAQAIHGIRVAAARQTARGREVRVIGCVSVLDGEGTSTFGANLAFALAAEGQRTALVDLNTNTPWLTEMLSSGSKAGVQELAAHESILRDVTLTDNETGLHFIGQSVGLALRARPKVANLRGMLAELRDRYDVVVLDLPPMKAGGAATLLSDLVDGFVLVTKWGSTPQSLLSEALSQIVGMDALFLGAVLSQCDPKRMRLYPRDQAQIPGLRAAPVLAAAGD
jgi:succinoglycan biosynthesis transport protein ExoP